MCVIIYLYIARGSAGAWVLSIRLGSSVGTNVLPHPQNLAVDDDLFNLNKIALFNQLGNLFPNVVELCSRRRLFSYWVSGRERHLQALKKLALGLHNANSTQGTSAEIVLSFKDLLTQTLNYVVGQALQPRLAASSCRQHSMNNAEKQQKH